MTATKRLSICYAVPGHYLLAEVGPTCNVLSVGDALSRHADVTLAFRKVIRPAPSASYKIIELDPEGGVPATFVDDSAVRGTDVRDLLRYVLRLRQFADRWSGQFDLLLEKSWLLSGYLTRLFDARGVPGILVENLVRIYDEPLGDLTSLKRYARHCLAQALVRHFVRKLPGIIAETDELKTAMMELWGVAGERIAVVELGVDRRLFHPMDQGPARQALGIDASATVLLYVGVLDRAHDLGPVIEALIRLRLPGLQLHVVGDGLLREAFEKRAQRGDTGIVFHGRVAQTAVPRFVGAADLCLAPYEPRAFFRGRVAFSTLKILEYMACARPVVSVPSGHILTLIQDGVSGFLVPNEPDRWMHFLRSLPGCDRLREMGLAAAAAAAKRGWETTARGYLQVGARLQKKKES